MAKKEGLKLTLTIPEASKLLGISRGLGYEAARRGEIPTVRIGGRIVVSRSALEEMLRRAAHTGTSAR
jgi:excisionase family DNA binding protein